MGIFALGIAWAGELIDPMSGRNLMMPTHEAEKKWGRFQFDEKQFRKASTEVRAKMAADLAEKNPYIGTRPEDIKAKLGEFTGYYWKHRVPAYLIEEGWQKKSDTWQLVFILDSNGLVKEVKIHKNCCYESGRGNHLPATDDGKTIR
jgi:hypothetical protein